MYPQRITRPLAVFVVVGGLIAATLVATPVAQADSPTITVSDAGMAACLRTKLGGPVGGTSFETASIATITSLDCFAFNITDVSALAYAAKLTSAKLESNHITDLSPLASGPGSTLTSLTATTESVTLPSVAAGTPFSLATPKNWAGASVAKFYTSADSVAATIANGTVTWASAGTGVLYYQDSLTSGGATYYFAGSITQTVTPGVAAPVTPPVTAPVTAPGTGTTQPTAPVPLVLSTTAKPRISGSVRVGKKLHAKSAKWNTKVTLHYAWLRGGKAIKKATKSTYTLTRHDTGKKIAVRVTATRAGSASVAITSKTTKRVR